MLNFSEYINEVKKNGCNCWDGYKRVPGTEPCAPGSCVKESLEEGGLWANIHAKRKRIKNGSGERMRKPGSKGAPTDADFKAANEEVELDEVSNDYFARRKREEDIIGGKKPVRKKAPAQTSDYQNRRNKEKANEELSADEQFDLIEEVVEQLAEENGIDLESIWETLESVDDAELLEYAIDKKGHKSSTGGLTQKGVDAYNRKTGGNLQTAVTTPPSKLDPDSKAAKRRKSFCARMGGVKGPMKDDKGRPTRKALALRKWNC